jgi:phosphoglucosamine mutase
MKPNLFGTDGIRAGSGAYPLDDPSLVRLGAVIGSLSPSPRILIARDTRESGPTIEAQLCRGLGRGARVFSAGVLPTPGLAFLTRELGFDFGIMVSASHNPFSDNGIKLFNRSGEKISARLENAISAGFYALTRTPARRPRPAAALAAGAYADFLFGEGQDLAAAAGSPACSPCLAVDCANGAASRLAPALFKRLGLDIIAAHARPDGRNINSGCGSTHPDALQKLVRKNLAGPESPCRRDLGVAFDGDADRVIFCDARGRLLEGDHALFLIARFLLATEPRFNRVVVGTLMSNLGLERALKRSGMRFLRAGVGDKHVYRLMKTSGAILGGEPSGHVILRHRHTSGDGLLTALYVMKALRHARISAAALHDELFLFPQRTLSIRVSRKADLERWPEFQQAVARFSSRHGRQARLLARYSGTEPKLRIMIEARDRETIDHAMPVFQSLVEKEIGEKK